MAEAMQVDTPSQVELGEKQRQIEGKNQQIEVKNSQIEVLNIEIKTALETWSKNKRLQEVWKSDYPAYLQSLKDDRQSLKDDRNHLETQLQGLRDHQHEMQALRLGSHLTRLNLGPSGMTEFLDELINTEIKDGWLRLQRSYMFGLQAWGKYLYMRTHYTALFAHLISDDYLCGTRIVSGTPGIGKTFMGAFVLKQLVSAGKLVVYQYVDDFFMCEKGVESMQISREDAKQLVGASPDSPNNTYFLIDPTKVGTVVESALCRQLVFVSPGRLRNTDLKKSAEMFYLPTWDEKEMITLNDVQKDPLTSTVFKKRYDYIGGVPPLVFQVATRDPINEVSEAIEGTDPSSFEAVWGAIKSNSAKLSDSFFRLLHLNPIEGTNYLEFQIEFATPIVGDRVLEALKNSHEFGIDMLVKHDDSSFKNTYKGWLFEALLLLRLSSRSSTFKVCEIFQDDIKEENFIIEKRVFKNAGELTRLTESDDWQDYLFVPKMKNFESVDCFFVHKDELWLVQITVAKEHEVKFNGLKKVVDALKWEKRVRLVFLVDENHFPEYCKQNQKVAGSKRADKVPHVKRAKLMTSNGETELKHLQDLNISVKSADIPQYAMMFDPKA
jgi:hypothetical protein